MAVAVALLFLGLVVNWGVERGLDAYAGRLGADLLVIPEGDISGLESLFWLGRAEKKYFSDKVIEGLRAIEGIEAASPQVFLESAAASCCSAGYVFLIGYDPQTDFTLLPWVGAREKKTIGPDDAIVGANIIQPVGLNLVFYSHRFKIVAQLDRTGLGVYDNAVYLPKKTVYRMAEESRTKPKTYELDLEKGEISAVFIKLEKKADPTEVSRKIEQRFSSIQAVRMDGLAQAVRKKLPRLQQNFFFWLAAVWVSVFFFLAAIFYLFNQTRRREQGLIIVMGGNRNDLVALMFLESGILMAAGGITGIVLAVTIELLFYRWLMLTLKVPLLYPAFSAQLSAAALVVGSVVVLGLAASTYPAYLAATEEPYESVRFSG